MGKQYGFLLALPLALGLAVGAATAGTFSDPLDRPAQASPLAARAPLAALVQAGTRLVAAGSRGHILLSDDRGKTWIQAAVPVSSDLVALHFPDQLHGWAVGHDGVILATGDAGKTWHRQFDGRQLGPRGAENPLLDVWFADPQKGWAVGAFGLILATTDGGQHWQALPLEVSDNPKSLHLYALRGIAGSVYAVGEQGLALKLNEGTGRFEALSLPYAGTLFGINGDESLLIVHGLRGNALRSEDGGKTWQAIATGVQAGLSTSTRGADGSWYLASQSGHVLRSRDGGRSFAPLKLERVPPVGGIVVQEPGGLLVVGPRGAQLLKVH